MFKLDFMNYIKRTKKRKQKKKKRRITVPCNYSKQKEKLIFLAVVVYSKLLQALEQTRDK